MASKKSSLNKSSSILHDTVGYTSFKVVLFYCLLIIFFPIITFFATKLLIFDKYFDLTEIRSNVYSAFSAIIALHVALAIYIYRAYFEVATDTTNPISGKKQD